ncbi:MAG: M15 family metallopeptidase [Candidatus Paceibacterota bacterium]
MKAFLQAIFTIKNLLKTFGVLIVIGSIVGYEEYRNYQLSSQLKVTEANLQAKISETQNVLAQILTQNSSLNTAVQNVQSSGEAYSAQAGQISNVASTLYRLSKTDPKLLEKYSKVYFLNENYKPASLTNIDLNFLYNKDSNLQINTQISSYLATFLKATQNAGLNLKIISAYRSFGTQAILKSSYKMTYGAGTANSFSADQGYSEHQLGTALDFTTVAVGDTFSSFDKTPEYTWLTNNAYLYGFILSYPANNKYYVYEPWHWRFVGVDLATKLHRDGINFYELDQNIINDYLSVMFD